MLSYNILSNRSDLILEKSNFKYNNNSDIEVLNSIDNETIYKTILFNNLNNLEEQIKKELLFFLNKMNIKKGNHIFIVGLGNDNHTADSIGPKTLKHINVNSYLKKLNVINSDTIISSLEPGVLGETGILTEQIVKSVAYEIKPDLVILIDSYVSSNFNYLNKSIQITNNGILTGNGLKGLSSNLSYETLNVPVLSIGVTSAIEIKFDNTIYYLSSKDIDDYVLKISKIIGSSINNAIDELS